MLTLFSLATILLIATPDHYGWTWIPGAVAFVGCIVCLWQEKENAIRRRMGVLLGCIAVLAAADINTSTSNANFLSVGIPFAIVVFIPPLILARTDPGVIRYRFWPTKFRGLDLFYTIISIPLAWALIKFYWWANIQWLGDPMHLHWDLPPEPDQNEIRRLFIGINMVGIWDELFFVNTVFSVLRSLFKFRVSNIVQAVVYTSVLFDMAFTGMGILIVYIFAWTQGSMFEQSENLLYVLIVHLIVDFILVAAIVSAYYPDYGYDYLWRHGM